MGETVFKPQPFFLNHKGAKMAIAKDPKSGKWIAQIGSGDQGTRKKKRFSHKKDAEAWVREQESFFESEESKYPFGPQTLVSDMLSLYLKSLTHRNSEYVREIKVSAEAIFKACKIKIFDDLNPRRLTPFRLRDDLSPRTRNKRLGFLKSMCRFLEAEGWILKSPLVGLKSISGIKPEKRALDQVETEELLRAAHANSPKDWFPIIFTGLRLALRKGELLTLEWGDLDLTYKRVHIRDKPHIILDGQPHKCKWGSSRVLPLYPELEKILLSLPQRNNFIFPNPLGNIRWNNVNRDFPLAIQGAKIDRIKEVTPHTLRHTRISQLICYEKRNIKEVQVFAGHRNTTTTFGYLHLLGGTDEMISADSSLPTLGQITGIKPEDEQ